MALTFHDVVLTTTEPDMVTPLDGEWTVRILTEGGTLVDTDTGATAASERTQKTTAGTTTFVLPAVPQDDIDPGDATYQLTFVPFGSGNGRRSGSITTAAFQLDGNKTLNDLRTETGLPITPSILEQCRQYRDEAAAFGGINDAIMASLLNDTTPSLSRDAVIGVVAAAPTVTAAAAAAVAAALANQGILKVTSAPAITTNVARDPQMNGGVILNPSATLYTQTKITTGLPTGLPTGVLSAIKSVRKGTNSTALADIRMASNVVGNALAIPVTSGQVVNAMAYTWRGTNTNGAIRRSRLSLRWHNTSGTFTTVTDGTYTQLATAGVAEARSVTGTAPADGYVTINAGFAVLSANSETNEEAGATALIVTFGATAPTVYGDGEKDGWEWEGVPHASKSREWIPTAAETLTLRALPARVTVLEAAQPIPALTVTKTGAAFSVVSPFGLSQFAVPQNITQNITLSGSSNGAFEYGTVTVGGSGVRTGFDDVGPIRTGLIPGNPGLMGGNHGFPIRGYTNPDSKTTADLGSKWTDGTYEYALLQIDSTGKLLMGRKYTVAGDATITTDFGPTTGTLTHVSGATHTGAITATTGVTTQMWPAVGKVKVTPWLDTSPFTADGTKQGRALVIRETYEILDYADLYDQATTHIGTPYTALTVRGVVRVNNVFTFKRSVCRINFSLDELRPINLGPLGATQALVGASNPTRYIPGVGSVTTVDGTFDFAAGVSMASTFTTDIDVTKANLASATLMAPFVLDSTATAGFAQGYLPHGVRGDEFSTNATRLSNASRSATATVPEPELLFTSADSKKMYPFFTGGHATGWGRVTAEAFRAYLHPDDVTTVLASKSDPRAAFAAMDACVGITSSAA
jgi:hypothetical protein